MNHPQHKQLHVELLMAQRELRSALANRTVELGFGMAIIGSPPHVVFDDNLIFVDRAVRPDELLRTGDEMANDAGWRHLEFEVATEEIANLLRPHLLLAGFEESRLVTMRLGSVYEPGPTGQATLVTASDQASVARAFLGEQWWASTTVLNAFVARDLRMERLGRARFVVAPPDTPVARCVLLQYDGLAELDSVGTVSSHRREGHGRTVIDTAINVARSSGAGEVMLLADVLDWPINWYRRLGFEEVDTVSVFRRIDTTSSED